MKKNLWMLSIALTSILGASAALQGCGKGPAADPAVGTASAPVVAPVIVSSCPAGQFPLPYGCAPATDLATACYGSGGQVDGQGICHLRFFPQQWNYFSYFSAYQLSFFPRLTPSSVSAPAAHGTVQVYPGDTVTFQGNGGWGSAKTKVKKLWGIFSYSTSTLSCKQVDLDGYDDTQILNEGLPAGLVGTDGTEVFFLGSKTVGKRINNRGQFRIGFNTPSFQSGCYHLSIYELTINRCFNASGTVVDCSN